MKFVATKTAEQLDLQALHRVRERLVSQRTGIINQIRAFLLERGIAVRQGLRFLRVELPRLLATPPDVLSPRMVAPSAFSASADLLPITCHTSVGPAPLTSINPSSSQSNESLIKSWVPRVI